MWSSKTVVRGLLTRYTHERIMQAYMELIQHPAASVSEIRERQPELVEQARVHLATVAAAEPSPVPATKGRPVGVKNGEGQAPKILLKKLGNRHKQAISLVLQGLSREDAGEATGYAPEYITFLLQQPVAKEYIAHINRAVGTQLEALYGKSVQAIADGLRDGDSEVKLKAAKLQLQTTGRLEPDEDGKRTAEDVVQAILLGVQVNISK